MHKDIDTVHLLILHGGECKLQQQYGNHYIFGSFTAKFDN